MTSVVACHASTPRQPSHKAGCRALIAVGRSRARLRGLPHVIDDRGDLEPKVCGIAVGSERDVAFRLARTNSCGYEFAALMAAAAQVLP